MSRTKSAAWQTDTGGHATGSVHSDHRQVRLRQKGAAAARVKRC